AATATAATAIIVIAVPYAVNRLIGRASDIRGLRARTERVNQRTGLRILRKLCRKRCVLRLKRGNLLLREEVQNRVRSVALAVDNIARAGIDSVRNIAGIFCHIVVYAIDGTLGLAAAVSELIANLCKTLFACVLRLQNCGIYAAKSLAKRLLNACLTEFQVVKRRKRCVLRKTYCNVVARRNLAELVVQIAAAIAVSTEAPA